jgi:hypothetical protein
VTGFYTVNGWFSGGYCQGSKQFYPSRSCDLSFLLFIYILVYNNLLCLRLLFLPIYSTHRVTIRVVRKVKYALSIKTTVYILQRLLRTFRCLFLWGYTVCQKNNNKLFTLLLTFFPTFDLFLLIIATGKKRPK